MKVKRVVFWAHLSVAVVAGIFVLMMSLTGLLLAYQQEVVAWLGKANYVQSVPDGPSMSVTELARRASEIVPADVRSSLVFTNEPGAPVSVVMGRQGTMLLNPYTGLVIEDAARGAEQFFHYAEGWHRYLNAGAGSAGAAITGAANAGFLFLVLSGLYIWMPDAWRWPAVKFRMFFKRRPAHGKVRDFNWHHVFGFWALIPLFIVVLSGVVISYGWASNLVYRSFGEQPPQRVGPPRESEPDAQSRRGGGIQPETGNVQERATLDSLLATAKGKVADWHSISVPLAVRGSTISLTIEHRSKERRPPRTVLVADSFDGRVISSEVQPARPPQSPGQRMRVWFRFVHTGEQYGLLGKSLAAAASLAACFLVYTGLALAYRRLLRPLLRRDTVAS